MIANSTTMERTITHTVTAEAFELEMHRPPRNEKEFDDFVRYVRTVLLDIDNVSLAYQCAAEELRDHENQANNDENKEAHEEAL